MCDKEKKMIEGNGIEYLYNSILDIQGTIRAIDAKFFATIALLILPITQLPMLVTVFKKIHEASSFFGFAILCVFALSWLVSFVFTVTGIRSIENPSSFVKSENVKISGNFYGAEYFKISWFQLLFTKGIEPKTIKEMEFTRVNGMDESLIIQELAYEQAKLVFIRDLKIKRQRYALNLMLFSMVTGIGSWAYYVIKINL